MQRTPHRWLVTWLLTLPLCALAVPAAAVECPDVPVMGAEGAPGEDGGTVSAGCVEVVSGADPLEVEVTVAGGSGGPSTSEGEPAGNGGGASLGRVFGASDSGPVRVGGFADGGDGGAGQGGAESGDGASVVLHQAVDGETGGHLQLVQSARGGDAGDGLGGAPGSAVSVLSRHKSAELLELRTLAAAGAPSPVLLPVAPGPQGGPGAPARGVSKAVNDAGEVRTSTLALGGRGDIVAEDLPGTAGGDANALALGATHGDGREVVVGSPGFVLPPFPGPLPGPGPGDPGDGGGVIEIGVDLSPGLDLESGEVSRTLEGFEGIGGTGAVAGSESPQQLGGPVFSPFPVLRPAGAQGGRGGGFSVFSTGETPPGGDGGSGHSRSIGIAHGDSPVTVYDYAAGGRGGAQADLAADATPSRGGDAHSLGFGVGKGASPVRVHAEAAGGDAGSIGTLNNTFPPGGTTVAVPAVAGGDADATAVAIGRGEVLADARAKAGVGTRSLLFGVTRPARPGGAAHALATARGGAGEAVANAGSNTSSLGLVARAGVDILHSARVVSRVGPNAAAANAGRHPGGWKWPADDARSVARIEPAPDDVAEALADQPDLRAALDAAGVDAIPALGRLGASPRQWSFQSVASRLEVDLTTLISGVPIEEVFIGLFSPKIRRIGFQGLRVLLTVDGQFGVTTLVDEFFDDPREAEEFLDGNLLEIGPIEVYGSGRFSGSELVTLSLELESRLPLAGLEVDFLVGTAPLSVP